MVAHYPVPIQEDIRDLLGDLLGRGVAVDKTTPLELGDERSGLIASYITQEDDLGAICICDADFAILGGAALVMVPGNVAAEQLAAGVIEEQHSEVFHEVVNVLARLLNTPRTPHLRLDTLHNVPGDIPESVAKLVATPEFRRDFIVAIEGYGEGRFSLLVN